jgi:glycosyltransferase involved in cell wall biosynthesis
MRILMVSTEYPPMTGGVGRYSANLTKALRKAGEDVVVLSDEKGGGDYTGISPSNTENSKTILKVIDSVKPDVVHIQFEPGLYGLVLDPVNPKNSRTYIDSFYPDCNIPIFTTFHSLYTFREWMSQALVIKKKGKTGKLGIPARAAIRGWKNITNYYSFTELNRKKLKQGHGGICFSHYMLRLLKGGTVIYHGAEPAISSIPSKEEAREKFSLPFNKKIAVTIGFRTVTKGWDILDKVNLPDNWIIVSNSSKSYYSKEPLEKNDYKRVIDLERGFLSEEELSLLLLASDAVLLPYKVASGSGVMFDALAHGLPFVASNLEFFKEFAEMGLGITTKRNPTSFGKAMELLDKNYDGFKNNVDKFKDSLRWSVVADQHIKLYASAMR